LDTLDEELVEKMAEAGCCGMNLGIESSSEETLSRMNRKAPAPEHCAKILNLCDALKIHPFCFFIIGLPGERKRDILKTVRLAKLYNCSQIQFTFAIPYPETPLFLWADKHGYITEEKLSEFSGYSPVMRNEYLSIRRIKRIHAWAVKSAQMRRRLKKDRIRRSGSWTRSALQRARESAKELLLWLEKWWI
jgi:radical SAM superfamily enzyme YgiQ (UPF0313 family)